MWTKNSFDEYHTEFFLSLPLLLLLAQLIINQSLSLAHWVNWVLCLMCAYIVSSLLGKYAWILSFSFRCLHCISNCGLVCANRCHGRSLTANYYTGLNLMLLLLVCSMEHIHSSKTTNKTKAIQSINCCSFSSQYLLSRISPSKHFNIFNSSNGGKTNKFNVAHRAFSFVIIIGVWKSYDVRMYRNMIGKIKCQIESD